MLVNKITDSLKPHVWLAVWLNFVSNTNEHGCIKNCSFCLFRKKPVYMCPTKADLIEFLQQYKDKSKYSHILISGGGDPLFEFNKNKNKILMILDTIKQLGFTPVMQSYELDVIDQYFDTLFKDINTYYFSTEGYDEKLIKLADKLINNNKQVHISKVVNFSNKESEIDFNSINNWISKYLDHSTRLHLHENYTCCFDPQTSIKLYNYFANLYDTKKVCFHQHRRTRHKHIVLINNEVWAPFEYFHTTLLNDYNNFN